MSLVLKIIEKKGNPEKILSWLGARNQNHRIQRLIALKIKKEAPSQVKLLIKNQPWLDEDHWLGIVGHVLGSGISPERVIICHRGFSPNGGENPDKMRNIPNYEMAMGVKKQTGLPMIIDPSHSGGSVANVFKVVKEAKKYRFDGLMVEVHHCPEQAKTDKKQQLTFNELDKLLKKNMKKIMIKKDVSQIGILTDENVGRFWLQTVKKIIGRETVDIIIPTGEKSKSINQAKNIWRKMLKNGFDRKSLLINLGGGVIADLGGFCASTFMRGISFIQIPTTLLAMVDASVGGKTGVNLDDVKNIIGTFTLPNNIIIDVDFLKTLPKRELIAAFAEIIKHSLINSRKHFDLVTRKKPLEFNNKELIEIINRSVQLKRRIVEKDFKEVTGLRRSLNFGHTIGHAVETLCLQRKNPLLHGEAVAIGLVAESRLSNLMGLL